MGSIATSNKASQATTNQQVGVQGTAASGASGSISKGSSQAVGGGISLVFDTGNNKITTNTKQTVTKGGGKKSKTTSTGTGQAVPAAGTGSGGGGGTASDQANQAGGNIAVHIQQTDQGAVQAGTSVSLAALQLAALANEALYQSNTNATTLAEHALQAGADVAAVAIPTYAAQQITSNPINPTTTIIQPASGGGGGGDAAPINWTLILSVAGIALTGFVLLREKSR